MTTALPRTIPSLPTRWYVDEAHHQREVEAIWRREWLCIGREADWAAPGDYRLVPIAGQELLVLRGEDGELRAFHNTCRHRGSVLCTQSAGHFAGGRIVCPYHAWTYSLDGQLARTPRRIPCADFDASNYPLYGVALDTWAGFVFINLEPAPAMTLRESFGSEFDLVASWPLATLRTAHSETHTVACNWKLFWENFMECAHCPGVHPELSRAVPLYGKGLLRLDDEPNYQPAPGDLLEASCGEGVETWSTSGKLCLPPLPGIDPAAIATGMRFATFFPSAFVVGHRDYVRSVRLHPLGVDKIEVTIEWYVDPAVPASEVDVKTLTEFGRLVVLQDARACELAQRGQRSTRHEAGVLMPQEYDVALFHRWVQERLA